MAKRGRPKKPPEEQRRCIGISMDPNSYNALMFLSKNLGMKPSSVCKYLILQAKKDQVLRNIIKNNQVADLRANGALAWETNLAPGYHTIRRKDGSLYTYFKPDEEITVDQQEHDNTEEVTDEEVDFEFIGLEQYTKEDFINKYGQDAYDRRMYQQSHQVDQNIP